MAASTPFKFASADAHLQANEDFRARENDKELTGQSAVTSSDRLSERVEQRMKAAAIESTSQQRKGE